MTEDQPVFCDKCQKSYRSDAEHVADIMADIQFIIADAAASRWRRVKEQVEQKRLEL